MPLPRRLTWLPALALACVSPLATAGEVELRAQLAMIERQLEGIERQAELSAKQAAAEYPSSSGRYHFDFTRLRDDLQRVRAGVRGYMVPERAQPRDPVELLGDYRTEPPVRREAP